MDRRNRSTSCTVQSQMAVIVYFTGKQILFFGVVTADQIPESKALLHTQLIVGLYHPLPLASTRYYFLEDILVD